jgi:hypothetical protein
MNVYWLSKAYFSISNLQLSHIIQGHDSLNYSQGMYVIPAHEIKQTWREGRHRS